MHSEIFREGYAWFWGSDGVVYLKPESSTESFDRGLACISAEVRSWLHSCHPHKSKESQGRYFAIVDVKSHGTLPLAKGGRDNNALPFEFLMVGCLQSRDPKDSVVVGDHHWLAWAGLHCVIQGTSVGCWRVLLGVSVERLWADSYTFSCLGGWENIKKAK